MTAALAHGRRSYTTTRDAIDEAQLNPAMQAVADFTGASAATHVLVDPTRMSVEHCAAVGRDPVYANEYVTHYSSKDVRIPNAISVPVGAVRTEDMVIDRQSLRRSELYNDLLLPADTPHFMFTWVRKDVRRIETLSMQGSLRHGAFDFAAIARYELLIPHVMRALGVRHALSAARQLHAVQQKVLDALPFGVIVLDSVGDVLTCSKTAADLMIGLTGLRCVRDRLHAVRSEDESRLQRAIANVVSGGTDGRLPGDTLRIGGRAERPALTVTVLPVSESRSALSDLAGAAALVLVVDPTRSPPQDGAGLKVAFGLTAAEARLALALYKGLSLREATAEFGVALSTGKTQLKSVFAKMGCRRQAEMVRAVMMLSLGAPGARNGAVG